MQLTKLQLQVVQFYLDHRHHAPKWSEFLRLFGRTLVVWAITGVVGSYLCAALGGQPMAWLVAGMMIGATLREVRHYHAVRQLWPATTAIIDWKRAERLVAAQKRSEPPNSNVS